MRTSSKRTPPSSHTPGRTLSSSDTPWAWLRRLRYPFGSEAPSQQIRRLTLMGSRRYSWILRRGTACQGPLRTTNQIPPALDELVLPCLAKKASDRPASARALATALAAIDINGWGEEEAHTWWQAKHPEEKRRDRTSTGAIELAKTLTVDLRARPRVDV